VTAANRDPADDGSEAPPADLATRLEAEITSLDHELAEIEMLVSQARTEAGRHEQKRTQTAEKLTASSTVPPDDLLALNQQLVTLTRRAAVMEAQVDVLEGKQKTVRRFRDLLAELSTRYSGVRGSDVPLLSAGGGGGASGGEGAAPMSRIVLNAQEDLRREIARSMHDGPAQSLTNIVLQAQIVERLLGRDLEAARGELRLLQSMVQQTLDATKTFIFEVRPMVLDDLGLVPTLRRAARERASRAGIPVEFESIGADHRLVVDLESSLFRIVDEALAAYLASIPDGVSVHLDWSDGVVVVDVAARRAPTEAIAAADRQVQEAIDAAEAAGKDLPPALESMLAERRSQAEAAASAARDAAVAALPKSTWREIQQRASSTGVVAELLDGGARLHLRAEAGDAGDGVGAGSADATVANA
jgi:two-component system, NarL family, sensor histidine kinase DegS